MSSFRTAGNTPIFVCVVKAVALTNSNHWCPNAERVFHMHKSRFSETIGGMNENDLRVNVVVPLLRATPDIQTVTDVHGQNERGLDAIFTTDNEIETITYGLQLKAGDIKGGGTGSGTVKEIVDQLLLADDFAHPVAVRNLGEVQIDRFVIATSGSISATAREEIARRIKKIPVLFWDGNELARRIHRHIPDIFEVKDSAAVTYLRGLESRLDLLDALDQIPGVAKR